MDQSLIAVNSAVCIVIYYAAPCGLAVFVGDTVRSNNGIAVYAGGEGAAGAAFAVADTVESGSDDGAAGYGNRAAGIIFTAADTGTITGAAGCGNNTAADCDIADAAIFAAPIPAPPCTPVAFTVPPVIVILPPLPL